MVDFLFTTREGLAGDALETIGGGISALVGIYVWDKLMGPVNRILSKWLGNYSGPITAFVLALIILHIARSQEGLLGRFLQVMSYAMFGDSIAKVFGIDPVMVSTGMKVQNVSPWSTLEPVPLPWR
jgi:hypothetical protein